MMVQYYQASDVFIHAAHHEVFGKSIVEAMACGIPVVATSVDGIPEIIDNGVTGYLTPPKDPQGMAAKIEDLFNNSDLYERISMNAIRHARKRYNLDRQVNDFISWYCEILDRDKNKKYLEFTKIFLYHRTLGQFASFLSK